jgi:hypothetical protein
MFDVTRNFTLLGGWHFYLSIYLVTFHFARIEPMGVLDFTHPFGGREKEKDYSCVLMHKRWSKNKCPLLFIFLFSFNDLYL